MAKRVPVQALDPEFSGAGATGDPELLEAALDLVAWIHEQVGAHGSQREGLQPVRPP